MSEFRGSPYFHLKIATSRKHSPPEHTRGYISSATPRSVALGTRVVLLRPVNNFLGQVIGNASEGKYNTVNNSSSREVTFQKCLNSGITLFLSKNSNKSQTFATGAYQRLHEARPRRVVCSGNQSNLIINMFE